MREAPPPRRFAYSVRHGRTVALVTDILGRTRGSTRMYGDGSFACPFCDYPISPDRGQIGCPNPACAAYFDRPMSAAGQWREHEAKSAKAAADRAAEEASRQEILEFRKWYGEKRRASETKRTQEITAEAAARGACQTCALKSSQYGGKIKYVRHKKGCPVR